MELVKTSRKFLFYGLALFPILPYAAISILLYAIPIIEIIAYCSLANYRNKFSLEKSFTVFSFLIFLAIIIFKTEQINLHYNYLASYSFLFIYSLSWLLPVLKFSKMTINNALKINAFAAFSLCLICVGMIIFSENIPSGAYGLRDTILGFPFLQLHPSYISMFLAFACFNVLFLVKSRVLKVLFFSFSSLIIFLLLSRIGLILMVGVLFSYILFFSKSFSLFSKIGLLVCSLVIVAFIIKLSGFDQRIIHELNLLSHNVGINSSISKRVIIWDCATQLISENVFGYGYPEASLVLNNCLSAQPLSEEILSQQLDTHNYFIKLLLHWGIFGLLSFLFALFSVLILVFKKNLFPIVVGIILFLTTCLTENTFDRLYGQVFLVFILHLAMQYNSKEKFA